MPRFTFLFLFFLLSSSLLAQQEPIYAQYRLNAFAINPAVAGSEEQHELRLNHRTQWGNFPGAPTTTTLSYHSSLDEKSGLGALVFRDVAGPSLRVGFQGAYAFRVPLGQEGNHGQSYLGMGLAGKFVQYRFRTERLYTQDAGDIAIAQAGEGFAVGDVAFGLHFYNDHLTLGFSSPNLLQSTMGSSLLDAERSLIGQLYRHYYAYGSYRFVYDQVALEPGFFVRKVATTPYQIEGNLKAYLLDEQLMLGVAYRTDWLLATMIGVKVKGLHFMYTLDLASPRNAINGLFGPTHELTLGIDLSSTSWRRTYFSPEED
jgi:type IX secretion system PorP/SprF family membrane protein